MCCAEAQYASLVYLEVPSAVVVVEAPSFHARVPRCSSSDVALCGVLEVRGP